MAKIKYLLFFAISGFFIALTPLYSQTQEIILDAHHLKQHMKHNKEYYHAENFRIQKHNHRKILQADIGNIRSQDGIEVFSIDLRNKNITLDSLTTFSWKWMIKDTDFSEGIFIKLIVDNRDLFSITSHTNRSLPTSLNCFEKNSVWAEHKINLFDLYNLSEKAPQYINQTLDQLIIITLDAYNQDLAIEYFKFSSEPLANVNRIKKLRFAEEIDEDIFYRKPVSACLSDMDRDGDLDLYLVNQGGRNYALLNDGHGRFGNTQFLYDGLSWAKNSHANFFDLNSDGWPDLFEGRENTNNQLFINKGSNRFKSSLNYQHIANPFSQTYSSLAGFYDTDKNIDFIEISATLHNESDPRYLFILNQNLDLNLIPHFIGWGFALFGGCAADINDDTRLDFFTANNIRQNYLLYLNDSLYPEFYTDSVYRDPFFPENKKYRGFTPSEGAVFWDFDNDGDLDIYVGNDGKPNQLFVQIEGKFVESAGQYGLADSLASEGFLIADFDQDMDWDVYIIHTYQPNTLLLNDGNGYFRDGTEGSGFEYPGGSVGGACGDLDNDGDIDIVQVDPGRGHRILLNPINNNHFVKLNIRGQPGNYHGIRSKIYIYEKNEAGNILKLYHQTPCGDGFQFEAFPRDFHFGLIPGPTYVLRVIFSDGREYLTEITKPGQTVLAIYPAEHVIGHMGNLWLYKIHEPFLTWLRFKGTLPSLLLLLLSGLLLNFGKVLFIRRFKIRLIIGFCAVILIFLFLRDLRTIHTMGLVALTAGSVFFSETVLESLRRLLRRHYVQETSWDRLFDHLQAFRHGGIALKNMDRLIFLFQNLKTFEGDIDQYKKHIADAIQTYMNQTSWQLTQLVYILKNLHWNHFVIADITLSNKRLIQQLRRIKNDQSKSDWRPQSIQRMIQGLKNLQKTIETIHRKILHHFVSNPAEICKEVIDTRFSHWSIKLNDGLAGKKRTLIKGYELGNIIADLIENGHKACQAPQNYEGKIELTEEDQTVCIDVTDNGCGIPKTDQKMIFEKGFSKSQNGGGFGLFYSREILSRYGGDISIRETAKNKGTTMRLRLRKITMEV